MCIPPWSRELSFGTKVLEGGSDHSQIAQTPSMLAELEGKASARASGSSTCGGHSVRDWLGSLADQHVVGSWGGVGADGEQRSERGMPCSAPIEAEHELVEVVLEVGPAQSVVDAQAPALEI